MKRLGGPELKTPELKTPEFLNDLYYDLRDRRLLPFVALVLVAIAAVPFLLGSGSEATYVPPGGGLSALGAEKTSKLTVVEATPGLRDYRKRLGDRTPTDPFIQRYTGLPAGAQVTSSSSSSEVAQGGSSTETSTSTGTEGGAVTPEEGSTEGGGSGGGATPEEGGSGSQGGAPRLIQFVIDLQITHMETTADGKQKMSDPEVRHNVRPLTQLPGEKRPVVTFAGLNLHTEKLYFLVSDEVSSLGGEFVCATRTPEGLCELLELEKGIVLEATFGPQKILYRFKVTKIDVIVDGRAGDNRSSRASFATPPVGVLPSP